MAFTSSLKDHDESILLLFSGSRKAIPFNIALAFLLAINMSYDNAPLKWIITWFISILIISGIRWFFCNWVLNTKLSSDQLPSALIIFLILTFIMGCTWGACYLIAVLYLTELHEFMIILVFGGMCAGAIASLSIWLLAYIVYILPMFLPVIFYNYMVLNTDRSILATMFLLFVIMIVIIAKLNNFLLNQTFKLTNEKELLIRELQELTITDSLTGLYNRRFFEETLQKEFNRGKRNQYSISLVSIDVDNFKLINDNLGHPYGDQFLINLAELLKRLLSRANDTVFRLGGDEFSAVLINMSINEAIALCEKVKDSFKKKMELLRTEKQTEIFNKITLSMGIVYIPFDSSVSLANVIIAADHALYQSKQQGKNKITLKKLD